MKIFIIIPFIMILGVTSFAQTNEQEAFQTFKKAREAFQNENYENSAKQLLKTKELLGSTNIRIQPMLIKSLVNIEDWRQAIIEVTIYYGLNPDSSLVEFQEIVNHEKNIKTQIYEEEQLYSSCKSNNSVSQYQSYLNKYPFGKYREEVQNLLDNQQDENAWERAKSYRSISAYYEYLDNFPNGNYATSATETIKSWDKEAYEVAISQGTQEALIYYLNNYPRGEYEDTVRYKLYEKTEFNLYTYAKNRDNIEDYEAYIKEYPYGKYTSEVNREIENIYYKFGNAAYALKKYSEGKGYYETYISKFPIGTYSTEARSKIKKCQRKLNQRSAGYWMITYDSEGSFGFSLGTINKNKVGGYGNFKMNPEIFTFPTYDIDDAGNSTWIGDVVRTGDVRYGNMCISGGLTFKIGYPLWAYIGGGAGSFSVYEQGNLYFSNGDFDEEWFKNTDKTKYFQLFPEGGLKLKVADTLVIKYGIMYFDGLIHQLGLGFKFTD